jgi:sporulation protein YlmC with PRC-barrel domain
MNKLTPLALAAALATFSLFPIAVHAEEAKASVVAGKAIYSADGKRIGAIYRVTQAGVVQVILEGKLVSVPAETISESNGKIVTSVTKSDLLHSH